MGIWGGLADAFAKGQHDWLDSQMQQRKAALDTLTKLVPEAHPDAQVKLLQKIGGLINTPMHKQLDKNILDLTDVMTPPPGSNQRGQPTPDMPGFDTGSELAQPPQGFQAQGEGARPLLTGSPGQEAGAPRGFGLPTPPAAFAPPQYNMTSTPNAGPPIAGTGFAAPPPPAYTPIFSPEEKQQAAVQQSGATTHAQLQAQIEEREKLITQHPEWNFQQIELALGHQPTTELGDPITYIGPKGEKLPGMRNRYSGAVIDQRGQVVPNAQVWDEPTPFKVTLEATIAHGGSPMDAANLWNSRYSETSGVRQEIQPDGSIKEIPIQTGSVSGRGTAPPPGFGPPQARVTGPGVTVGGRVSNRVQEQFDAVNAAEQRYAIMQDALPKALAGDGQAAVNLVANHLGMTAGLQKGSRITQALWGEAVGSAPWLDRVLSHITVIDPQTGDHVFIADPLSGITLTPGQARSMVGLAKTRLDQEDKAYDRIRQEARNGYGMNLTNPKTATPATHQWSKSAWKKANPSGDLAAAEKAAEAANYEVVP